MGGERSEIFGIACRWERAKQSDYFNDCVRSHSKRLPLSFGLASATPSYTSLFSAVSHRFIRAKQIAEPSSGTDFFILFARKRLIERMSAVTRARSTLSLTARTGTRKTIERLSETEQNQHAIYRYPLLLAQH